MQEILSIFHIDAQMLIAQLVNFTVLMVLIVYVVVRPLRRVIAEREEIIKGGVENALHAETKIAQATRESEHIVVLANEDAYRIRAEANKTAEHTLEMAQERLHQESLRAQSELEAELAAKRERDLIDFKRESTSLAIITVEKLLQQKFNDAEHSRRHLNNLVN